MRSYHFIWPLLGLFLGRELFTFVPLRMPVHIQEVLDGDTLELRGGERLRLASIDAPEKGQLTRRGHLDAGLYSTQCLKRWVRSRSWQLQPLGRDMYGRQLGELWDGSVNLAELLIEQGCVSVYPFNSNSELRRSLEIAQRTHQGLWSHGGFMRPFWWRKKKGPFRGL